MVKEIRSGGEPKKSSPKHLKLGTQLKSTVNRGNVNREIEEEWDAKDAGS